MIRAGLARSRKAMPVEVVGYEVDETGSKRMILQTTCVRLDIFGTVRHVTKANFKPCSILVKFEEINLRFKDLMDMDADKAIQYIKERWNNDES